MKPEVFKNLIKEAVREAVREELTKILSEDVQERIPKKTPEIKYQQTPRPVAPKSLSPEKTGVNALQEIFNMTKASMTQEEYRNLASVTEGLVQAPGLGMNMMEQFTPTPVQSFASTEMDFVSKAAAIYKASLEKDKARAL